MTQVLATNGWRTAKLGQLANIRSGGSAPQGDEFFGGQNPFVRVQHLDESSDWVRRWDLITDEAVKAHRLKSFPQGTIVLPKSGASIRLEKRARLTTDAYLVSHLAAISPKSDDIDATFLFYALRAASLAREKADGYPTLNLSELAEVQVPLPPVGEQRAISKVLGVVRRAQEACARVIVATRELKRSLVRHLFIHGPIPFQDIERSAVRETETGILNESWPLVPCQELCKEITVGVVVRPSGYYVEAGVPAFRSLNVREDRLNRSDMVFFSKDANEGPLAKSRLRHGDVLIVRTGYPGTSCVVPPDYDGANCIDLVIARPDHDRIDSHFLSRFFNSPAGRRQALSAKVGLAQQHLNVGAVKRCLVPLPPLSEQREVSRQLASVDGKLATEETRRACLEALFETLLHRFMRGEVRLSESTQYT